MNIYLTTGTYDYMKKVKEKHAEQQMLLMESPNDTLLLQETTGKSIFQQPRKYEVLDSTGDFAPDGYIVFNNIPVTDEGRPVFEYRFKNRDALIEKFPGFVAFRLLRPLSNDTYIVMTMWEDEQSFKSWTDSKAFGKAHGKKEKPVVGQDITVFAGPSYISSYRIPKEEE